MTNIQKTSTTAPSPLSSIAVFADLIEKADLRPKTKRDYKRAVLHFDRFLSQREPTAQMANVLIEYKQFLQNSELKTHDGAGAKRYKDLSPKTHKMYLSAAKKAITEAEQSAHIAFQPGIVRDVSSPKVEQGHVKDGLSETEVQQVFSFIKSLDNERKRLILNAATHLLAFQGLRQKELVSLRVSSFDFKRGLMYVKGKGTDDLQELPILDGTGLEQAVQELIKHRGLTGDDYIFHSERNRSSSKGAGRKVAVSTAYMRQLFTQPNKGVFAKAGVHGQGLHGFRHFCFSYMATAGYTLEQIMAVSRHKNASTVQVYIDKVAKRAAQKAIRGAFKGFNKYK